MDISANSPQRICVILTKPEFYVHCGSGTVALNYSFDLKSVDNDNDDPSGVTGLIPRLTEKLSFDGFTVSL